MAALTEDSVLTSLGELRRMAAERARQEEDARRLETERRAADEAERRARLRETREREIREQEMRERAARQSQAMAATAPYAMLGGPTDLERAAAAAGAYARPMPFSAMTETAKPRSAAGPVLLTILLLGGAGGAGYWKLQQDFQGQLRAREAIITQLEDSKRQAIESVSRSEQQAKVKVAACEDRVTALTVERERRAAAAAAVASVETAAPAAAPRADARRAKPAPPRPSQKASAAAAAPAKAEEAKPAAPVPMPKVARKKSVGDDPLAGLKL